MGIIFHDGKHPLYRDYSGGMAWNDPSTLGTLSHDMRRSNTEEHITALLGKADYRSAAGDTLAQAIAAPSDITNVYVLKGLHQLGRGFVQYVHITIGVFGAILHLDYLLDTKGWQFIRATAGASVTATDADGWTEVKRKR